jgi:hypothetical protein
MLLLLVLSFAALPTFIYLLWKVAVRSALLCLAASVPIAALAALATLLAFRGASGEGVLLICAAFAAPPLSVAIFLAARQGFDITFALDATRRRLYTLGGLSLILLQLAPAAGVYGLGGYCNGRARAAGDVIAAAAQNYHQAYGDYPAALADLVPVYLPAVPNWRCLGGWGPSGVYQLQRCPEGAVLLTTPSAEGASVLRYNLPTQRWSGISLLDGTCDFLEAGATQTPPQSQSPPGS